MTLLVEADLDDRKNDWPRCELYVSGPIECIFKKIEKTLNLWLTECAECCRMCFVERVTKTKLKNASVAQLDRAYGYGP